ncbi:MAG: MFS transporter [Clostridiales bacterium]|nr:MFS transporter [Clostridiales bacterium]
MKKMHYAWAVLASCCAISFGFGLTANSAGQYLVPILTELEFGMGEYQLSMSIRGVFSFISLALLNKMMAKINLRLLMSSCMLVMIAGMALTSTFTHLWQWYAIGAVMGFVGPPTQMIIPPILINNWFVKKKGFAIGIAMTFSGIGGAIMNPVLAWIIQAYNWRVAYFVNAAIVGLILMPFLMFVVALKPSDKGLKPYGYEETEEDASGGGAREDRNRDADPADTEKKPLNGVPYEKAIRSISFIFMLFIFGVSGFVGGYNQILTAYGISLGLTATAAAFLPSLGMIGNVAGKVVLGVVSDKAGGMVMMYAVLGIGFSAMLLLLTGVWTPVFFLAIGAFLSGNLLTLISVGTPLLTSTVYGERDYSRIYVALSLGQSVISTLCSPLIGFMYDFSGGFTLSFMVGTGVLSLSFGAVYLAYKTSRKLYAM